MKVALAHDYLNQYGGAERVLGVFSEMFPDAPIYTLFYDDEATHYKFAGKKVIPSMLQRVPGVSQRHRMFIPIMPFAVNGVSIEGYDLVISSTAGYAKGFNTGDAYHITYCHTPLRYAWEAEEYLKTHPYFRTKPAYKMGNAIAKRLKSWDKKASLEPNIYIANSNHIADKIKNYYRRDPFVVHPPVDENIFYYEKEPEREFYLAVGRMLHYKRFDLIVDAFKELGLPLRVVGSGPEETSLRKRAEGYDNIDFIPFTDSENDLRGYYNKAKAFVFPQVEDFGLVGAEAIMCGAPVIGYNEGGVREIVDEGKTGIFFDEQTVDSLVDAVKKLEKKSFNNYQVARRGKKFSKSRFKDEIEMILREQGFSL